MSTYTNLSSGGVSGGILSYTEPLRSQTFQCYSSGEHAVLECFTTHRCVARCVTGLSQAKF